ncbi:hypothetical protein PISMIDRAFT_13934 [Pisolithus microcarpus 441]|uniref:Unplaced genomic scaffold scaffold_107, whole genome shotgun sequence n=1 Tax=Pisolithus microcarpus 441 TaxID=765257 RepID=A0A0C9YYT7_9AGAM|nr:hypothetical protein PISMIDRAFT_13934 [Pisolithus microcarpus 441]
MSSSTPRPQTIVPWETALPDELEDKPGDSVMVKMAKFDERQRRQCLALQRELEAKEQRMAEEAERVRKEQEAEVKRIRELEAERKRLEEETRWAQQAGGSSQVPASTGKAIERPNGCSMCVKAGEECKPGTGRSKSCVQCQKLKAKCDLTTQMTDTEKRPVDMTSPRGGEKWKRHRKSKALMEVVIDMDDRDDEAMEDTPDVETVSCPRVLRTLPPCKDSVAEVLDRRLGEVVKLLQKNNNAIATLAGDVRDLSGVLEESFKALKTATMALVSWAQNADDV